jgi:hypothetical protein
VSCVVRLTFLYPKKETIIIRTDNRLANRM